MLFIGGGAGIIRVLVWRAARACVFVFSTWGTKIRRNRWIENWKSTDEIVARMDDKMLKVPIRANVNAIAAAGAAAHGGLRSLLMDWSSPSIREPASVLLSCSGCTSTAPVTHWSNWTFCSTASSSCVVLGREVQLKDVGFHPTLPMAASDSLAGNSSTKNLEPDGELHRSVRFSSLRRRHWSTSCLRPRPALFESWPTSWFLLHFPGIEPCWSYTCNDTLPETGEGLRHQEWPVPLG